MNKKNYESPLSSEQQLELEQKEAFNEYAKSQIQYIKSSRKKFVIIMGLIIVAILIIKVFCGTINIPNIFGYPSSKGRYYIVKVNNKQVPVSYNNRHRIPIIPFLINFDSYYLGNNYIEGYNGSTFYDDNRNEYVITISSNSCYYENKYQVECTKIPKL